MPKRKRLLFGRLARATKSSHEPAVDHKCHSGKTDSALTSWNDLQKEDSPSGAGLTSKIRRGSARLLSKLGLRTSVDTKDSAQNSVSDDSFDVYSSCSNPESQQNSENMITHSYSPDIYSSSSDYPTKIEPHQPQYSNPELTLSVSNSTESVQNAPEDVSQVETAVERPNDNPLTRHLSQKLSFLGPTTVIRRAKTRARPGITPVEGPSPLLLGLTRNQAICQSSDRSTIPSQIFSNSEHGSSLDGGACSLFTMSTSRKSSVQRIFSGTSRSTPSIQLYSRATVKPSIVTVEATANAKVFFETHFNAINSPGNGRKLRFQELQAHLSILPFSKEEQLAIQSAWAAQESEYLRKTRVLKARSNRSHSQDTLSLVGYEVIRILGQGSFGTVQLVKETGPRPSLGKEDILQQPGDSFRSGRLDQLSKNKVKTSFCSSGRSTVQSNSARVYAMKVIRKAEMVRLCQEGHIRAEREILSASERSKWIVPLVASFQDPFNLYLVMEYELGGDFFAYLVRQGVLSEGDTMWYAAEMIICVEEAHRLGWIHRDVKPENFLISASGHLKLADFGLAFDGHWSHNQEYFTNHRQTLLCKLGIDVRGDAEDQGSAHKEQKTGGCALQQSIFDGPHDLTDRIMLERRNRKEKRRFARSIVGTSQYMAPEVVDGEPYDGRCDYWSIGIIIYECLYGMTPFNREDREETKKWIRNHRWTLRFPQDLLSDVIISYHAIDLMQRLLQKKEFRLSSRAYKINDCAIWHGLRNPVYPLLSDPGSRRWKGYHVYADDASDIKSHRWFRDISWNEMLLSRPPYVPQAKSWEDIKWPTKMESGKPEGTPQKGDLIPDSGPSKPSPPLPKDANAAEQTALKKAIDDPLSKKRKHKEKRARDKILRDTVVGPTALEIRTKGAFVGYTWRRPKSVRDLLEVDRGQSLV